MIDWLPHVAEAPAALRAYPWGRARADAPGGAPTPRRHRRVLEGDEARALARVMRVVLALHASTASRADRAPCASSSPFPTRGGGRATSRAISASVGPSSVASVGGARFRGRVTLHPLVASRSSIEGVRHARRGRGRSQGGAAGRAELLQQK